MHILANMGPPPALLQQLPPMNEKQLPSLLSLKVDPPDQLLDGSGTNGAPGEETPVSAEVVLPQALEEVLALKNQRALELGTDMEESADSEKKEPEKENLWERDDAVVRQTLIISFIYI